MFSEPLHLYSNTPLYCSPIVATLLHYALSSTLLSTPLFSPIHSTHTSHSSTSFYLKVFAMTGWYPCVKQALIDRGWHFNPDPASPYFDLKWTLRSVDVAQETLLPNQLTNHFLKNVAITTKVTSTFSR